MNVKNGLICVLIVALLTLCVPNVAAAPVSKLTPNIHSNYAGDLRGRQQTYLYLGNSPKPQVTMGVGQSLKIYGTLAYGVPPTSLDDCSHGIPNATINIQQLSSDGKTWNTVATKITAYNVSNSTLGIPDLSGGFVVTLTPSAAGTYTYRFTYDGDSMYEPAVSSTITLIVNNVVVS
jgi:hypothetical protein